MVEGFDGSVMVEGLAIRVCGGRIDDLAGEGNVLENPGGFNPELEGLATDEDCDGGERGEVWATGRVLVVPGLRRLITG